MLGEILNIFLENSLPRQFGIQKFIQEYFDIPRDGSGRITLDFGLEGCPNEDIFDFVGEIFRRIFWWFQVHLEVVIGGRIREKGIYLV